MHGVLEYLLLGRPRSSISVAGRPNMTLPGFRALAGVDLLADDGCPLVAAQP